MGVLQTLFHLIRSWCVFIRLWARNRRLLWLLFMISQLSRLRFTPLWRTPLPSHLPPRWKSLTVQLHEYPTLRNAVLVAWQCTRKELVVVQPLTILLSNSPRIKPRSKCIRSMWTMRLPVMLRQAMHRLESDLWSMLIRLLLQRLNWYYQKPMCGESPVPHCSDDISNGEQLISYTEQKGFLQWLLLVAKRIS